MARFAAMVISLVLSLFLTRGQVAAATCRDMGQSVLDLSQAVGDLSISALKAGSAALSLTGTRSRYGPAFKTVEDEAAKGDQAFVAALRALGQLQSMQPDDPGVASATEQLLADATDALQFSAAYKGFALAYERAINSRNRTLARAAIAAAMGSAPPYATSYSTTTGSIYGNDFWATTTTTTRISDPGAGWRAAAQRYESDVQSGEVSRDEMQSYLTQYAPAVEMLPYKYYPIVNNLWIPACRAAR